uniref:PleD family two-component system response regulator n=1 Tax=Rickettsia sp. TH2014 TaxID=1967503 RepID=UPI001C447153
MTANILVVDDTQQNIELLEARLLSEYYTVFTATSGKQALEILAAKNIDVVLLDIMMPEMDGFEVCSRIKANPATTYIPVVMVTAMDEKEARLQALEVGADELLMKPINDLALSIRLKALTRTKALIDELTLRNSTNATLGIPMMDMAEDTHLRKIKIIDDDTVRSRNIKTILSKLTDHIEIISNIEEKDNKHSEENVSNKDNTDLVIISSTLEAYDPFKIVACITNNPNMQDTIIVGLSDEIDEEKLKKGVELGAQDYFMYPIDEIELQIRTRTLLKRKRYQENIRNHLEKQLDLSIKDAVTDLYNRHYFDLHVIQMAKRSHEYKNTVCLLMCDLDDFKLVNDKYGHQAGDEILRQLRAVLKRSFKLTDLVARYGGEEFVILVDDILIDGAEEAAERLCQKIAAMEFNISTVPEQLRKTVSIGVSEYKQGEQIEQFIARADKAMYMA